MSEMCSMNIANPSCARAMLIIFFKIISPGKKNGSELLDETGGRKNDPSRLRLLIGNDRPVTQISST